jgi:hypothetical protein
MATQKFESVKVLAEEVAANQELAETIKKDPSSALRELAAQSPLPDTWSYRIVVSSLGLAALITVVSAALLAGKGDSNKYKLPDGIIAVGAAAAGALSGLLAPTPGKS